MLEVSKGLGANRQDMETWFERAMNLDCNNLYACGQKLNWLSARWYGSDKEVVAFGRACRETRNYPSGIPLLLVTAHFAVCDQLPEDQMREYLSQDEVWKDISGVYEEHLKRRPTTGRNVPATLLSAGSPSGTTWPPGSSGRSVTGLWPTRFSPRPS